MPKWEKGVPLDGWPTRISTYIEFEGGWVRAARPLGLLGNFHPWVDWPGRLELGWRRPGGCNGQRIPVQVALIGHWVEADLLIALGARAAHVCRRTHHLDDPRGWCWCDACLNRRAIENRGPR